jgi:predicted N-acetyltransferase YhbS
VATCVIEPAGPSLAGVAGVYAAVGFRDDLVDDLRTVRDLGGDVFVALVDGRVVGASSFLPFTGSGWIGGVAVLPTEARRGIGQELTEAATAALRGTGIETALLHATAMARPLYERMGFRADGELVELRGVPTPGLDERAGAGELRAGRAGDLEPVLRLDRAVTGEDRSRLFQGRWPAGGSVVDDGTVRGFSLRGSGGSAGVVIAADADAGHALVAASLATGAGQQRIGLPVEQSDLRRLLEGHGLREHVTVTRMQLGPAVAHRPDRLFSVFNLYWG